MPAGPARRVTTMDDPLEGVTTTIDSLLDASTYLAPVAMAALDEHSRLIAANSQWRLLTGVDPSAADSHDLGEGSRPWLEPFDEPARRRVLDAVGRARAHGESVVEDVEMVLPSGRRWTRWWLHRRTVGTTVVIVAAVVDLHEDMAQNQDLRRLATHDDLTGLVNRRFFVEMVEQALRRAERFPEPACVLYIDLDGFKSVNDRAGHAVGDQVLGSVATRLRLAVRMADVVGRLGGDEFGVLIERVATAGEAAVVARRVQEALNARIEVAGERWPISASVGLAVSSGHETAAQLLARADQAMYEAKRDGTNPITVPDVPEQAPSPAAGVDVPPTAPVDVAPTARVDMQSLQAGMETIRLSLETLLRDLQLDPD